MSTSRWAPEAPRHIPPSAGAQPQRLSPALSWPRPTLVSRPASAPTGAHGCRRRRPGPFSGGPNRLRSRQRQRAFGQPLGTTVGVGLELEVPRRPPPEAHRVNDLAGLFNLGPCRRTPCTDIDSCPSQQKARLLQRHVHAIGQVGALGMTRHRLVATDGERLADTVKSTVKTPGSALDHAGRSWTLSPCPFSEIRLFWVGPKHRGTILTHSHSMVAGGLELTS